MLSFVARKVTGRGGGVVKEGRRRGEREGGEGEVVCGR